MAALSSLNPHALSHGAANRQNHRTHSAGSVLAVLRPAAAPSEEGASEGVKEARENSVLPSVLRRRRPAGHGVHSYAAGDEGGLRSCRPRRHLPAGRSGDLPRVLPHLLRGGVRP